MTDSLIVEAQLAARDKEIKRLTAEGARKDEQITKLRVVKNYAKDFIEQYQIVIKSDEYKGIWTFLHVHSNEYKGPIFRDPGYLIAALDTLSGSQSPAGAASRRVLHNPANSKKAKSERCESLTQRNRNERS